MHGKENRVGDSYIDSQSGRSAALPDIELRVFVGVHGYAAAQ